MASDRLCMAFDQGRIFGIADRSNLQLHEFFVRSTRDSFSFWYMLFFSLPDSPRAGKGENTMRDRSRLRACRPSLRLSKGSVYTCKLISPSFRGCTQELWRLYIQAVKPQTQTAKPIPARILKGKRLGRPFIHGGRHLEIANPAPG